MKRILIALALAACLVLPAMAYDCVDQVTPPEVPLAYTGSGYTIDKINFYALPSGEWDGRSPCYQRYYIPESGITASVVTHLNEVGPESGTFDLWTAATGGSLVSNDVDYNVFDGGSDIVIDLTYYEWNAPISNAGQNVYYIRNASGYWPTFTHTKIQTNFLVDMQIDGTVYLGTSSGTSRTIIQGTTSTISRYTENYEYEDGVDIGVNVLEKYSNAALINQAVTVSPSTGGAGETKTSLYGETIYFEVTSGDTYWFNASRAGYQDYNETYTVPASPGIYTVYMERILPPIANHSYAHFSVVDQTNGGLIPNAEIRLSDGQTKLTNSAGYAWFSVNNSEQINYYVSKPSGYWPAYGAMNLTADESILVALQRYTGPTATATMPGWTPVTVPTTGTGVDPVVTLSAQLRQQNVQEGMDVWYTNLPFISQFLFLLFIIGGLGLMAGGTRRN
jgi:hypothetical protein